jgi:hypothetical protein
MHVWWVPLSLVASSVDSLTDQSVGVNRERVPAWRASNFDKLTSLRLVWNPESALLARPLFHSHNDGTRLVKNGLLDPVVWQTRRRRWMEFHPMLALNSGILVESSP